MRKYKYTYIVEGKVAFPVDMLRYDSSFPDREGEFGSSVIENSVNHDTEGLSLVILGTWQDGESWKPSEGRWNSFGWQVVSDTVKLEAS